MNRCSHVLIFPQVAGTSMMGPSPSGRAVKTQPVQGAAGICFDVSHDSFGSRFRRNHKVNVARPDMGRQQSPSSERANFPKCFQDRGPSLPVQYVRLLLHPFFLRQEPRLVRGEQRSPRDVVVPIHRTRFLSVQSTPVAREGDQVSEGNRFCHEFVGPLAYGRGSDAIATQNCRHPAPSLPPPCRRAPGPPSRRRRRGAGSPCGLPALTCGPGSASPCARRHRVRHR